MSGGCRSIRGTWSGSIRSCVAPSSSSTATASGSACPTASWSRWWGASAAREELVAAADIVLLPKPKPEDLAELRDGQILWGWPHCVQDREITQLAIDKRLTLIAFEAMNHWASDGGFGLHVFHKNNELAGYCSVLHALQLCGSTGDYGRRLRAVVIGFGATARGAVTALNAHGVHDVQVLTNRGVAAVGSPIHSVRIVQFDHAEAAPHPEHCHHGPRACPAGAVPGRKRHRGQLHPAGSECAADVPPGGGSRCLPARAA